MSIAVIRRYEGEIGDAPSLRQAKIIGGSPSSHLSDLFTEPCPPPGSKRSRGPASASAPGASDHGDADYGGADYGGADYRDPESGSLEYRGPEPGGPEYGDPDRRYRDRIDADRPARTRDHPD
jgi:hypothetical protein